MSKIPYLVKRMEKRSLRIIQLANEVLDEYAAQGFVLTLRQLYYKFVARDLFPDDRKWKWTGSRWQQSKTGTKNADPNYKWLGDIVGDGRLCGLIDWEYLEDRTRNLADLQHFDGPQDALNKLRDWYHVDMWKNQTWRPEVWIEKDALTGVIKGVCEENDIPYFSCRGYTSLSEMWRASIRLRAHFEAGYKPYIIHFGDHDPSGIDMSRDITDRIQRTFLADCDFKRVALTMDQVEEFKPPPNPAKVTDSRYEGYVSEYGDESWELDALEPVEFRKLIEGEVRKMRDQKQWDADVVEREKVRDKLKDIALNWDKKKPAKKKPAKRKPKK